MSTQSDCVVEVRTTDDMRVLGEAVGNLVHPGQLIVLSGPLGAGKTTFVQGVARALGVHEPITSPTFVIARVHRGARMGLVHVDAYRLADPRDLSTLDLDEQLQSSVACVEWGSHVVAGDQHFTIEINREREDDVRVVTLPAALADAAKALHK